MTLDQLQPLLPLILIAATAVLAMLTIAFVPGSPGLVNRVTLLGQALTLVSLGMVDLSVPQQVTPLILIDRFAVFFSGLMLFSSIVITLLSRRYFAPAGSESGVPRTGEYYVLLSVAVLGAMVMVSSNHFASFFIGLELLGVSLYVMVAYLAHANWGRGASLEAGIKYLILSGVASALLLFGIALLYAEFGSLEFGELAAAWGALIEVDGMQGISARFVEVGLALILAGICFKLSLVPFHMWTPDVYEGAPAPAAAFVATVSKGAVFAFLLRFFIDTGLFEQRMIFFALGLIAILSMLGGNLLALLQGNIKRLLAYSSIAHIGYLMVAFLAGRSAAVADAEVAEAVGLYLVAYFITTLGAFGVVITLSHMGGLRDLDRLEDYRGLFWRAPLPATVLTAMLLSLAGIPLTVGFIGKFYLLTVGAAAMEWLLLAALILGSAIGLYYYLRVVIIMASEPADAPAADSGAASLLLPTSADRLVLAGLTSLLLWLGVYPQPLIELVRAGGL